MFPSSWGHWELQLAVAMQQCGEKGLHHVYNTILRAGQNSKFEVWVFLSVITFALL
jgi:hypothetical protein